MYIDPPTVSILFSNNQLNCTFDSNPSSAKITWFYNETNKNISISTQSDYSILKFNTLKPVNNGVYTCRVENIIGNSISSTTVTQFFDHESILLLYSNYKCTIYFVRHF